MLIMNRKKFLSTEFGRSLVSCVIGLDYYLIKYFTCSECEANFHRLSAQLSQWDVYKLAIKEFFGLNYSFVHTDEYYGMVYENEQGNEHYLVKFYPTDYVWYKIHKDDYSCVSGPFTHEMRLQYEIQCPDADQFIFMTGDEYFHKYRLDVKTQM